MNKSLKSRLSKGLSAQGFSQAVQVILRLGEVPLLLHFWGTQLYGEWLILSAIPAYLAMSDMGFTGTACRDMAIKVGADDRQGALVTFQSSWLLILGLSSVVIGVVLLGVPFVPLAHWFHIHLINSSNLYILVVILSARILTSLQNGLLYGGYYSEGQYGIGIFILACISLIEFGMLALVVFLGGGLVQAALGLLAGTSTTTICITDASKPWWVIRVMTAGTVRAGSADVTKDCYQLRATSETKCAQRSNLPAIRTFRDRSANFVSHVRMLSVLLPLASS